MRLFKLRTVALIATIALMGGTAFVAAGATGAYFSDTSSGTVSASAGSIQVNTFGGNGTDLIDFSLANMLPGAYQDVVVHYKNNGSNPEDVWIVFPNSTELSALNTSGTDAMVKIRSSARGGLINITDFGTGSGQYQLPEKILLQTSLAPGNVGTVTASFGIGATVSDQAAAATLGTAVMNYQIVATQHGIQPGA